MPSRVNVALPSGLSDSPSLERGAFHFEDVVFWKILRFGLETQRGRMVVGIARFLLPVHRLRNRHQNPAHIWSPRPKEGEEARLQPEAGPRVRWVPTEPAPPTGML